MINILHVAKKYTGNYPLFNNMVSLNKEKFRFIVCYLDGKDDNKNEIVDIVEKVYYLKSYNVALVKTLLSAMQLKNIIDAHNIEIVNCHLEKTMLPVILASKFSQQKPKIFTTIHGLVGGVDNRIGKKLKNFFCFRNLDRIICVSDSIKNDVIRANFNFNHNIVTSVQNGLTYEQFLLPLSKAEARAKVLPDCDKPFWFGTVGRLVEKKNHKNLLLALNEIIKSRQDFALLIAGSGPLEDSLITMANNLNLHNVVHFLGNRNDVPEILKSLDAFLFPTYREGLPLALLEAMASNLPVIASDIPVIREVFGGTEMGYLVDPDAPAEIAQAMLSMMNVGDEMLQKMGENAKQRALRDFSAAKMVQGYEDIFEKAFLHEA